MSTSRAFIVKGKKREAFINVAVLGEPWCSSVNRF